MAFLCGNLQCSVCGCTMHAKGSLVNTIIGALLGSVFLYLLIFGWSSGNWWPAVLMVAVYVALFTCISYAMGLGRAGTKKFRL